jgi:ankyrin repeat protein
LVRHHASRGHWWVFNTTTTGARPPGWRLAHFACDASDKKYERNELMKLLLENWADINAITQSGNTPFLLASAHGDVAMIKLLIASGADTTYVPEGRAGPRQRAAQSSGMASRSLARAGVPNAPWVESSRQRQGDSHKCTIRKAFFDPGAHTK